MIKQVLDFEYDCHRYGYNTEFTEFAFSRGVRNYTNITKRLKTITLPNPETFQYSKLTLEELKEYLRIILNKIFDSQYAKEIETYNQWITLEPIANPFDATLEIDIIEDEPIVKKFHVSDKLDSIEVVATAHEYIHALLAKYSTYDFNRVLSNVHYKELLSLLIEYISVYELSELLKKEELPEKHNIIRLHIEQQHVLSHEEDIAFLAYLKKKGASPLLVRNIQKCVNYDEHNSFGYITSDIYATRLFELYKDDPRTILKLYKAIIDGQKSINDLLNYYGISLRDNNTINSFTKRLENCQK